MLFPKEIFQLILIFKSIAQLKEAILLAEEDIVDSTIMYKMNSYINCHRDWLFLKIHKYEQFKKEREEELIEKLKMLNKLY